LICKLHDWREWKGSRLGSMSVLDSRLGAHSSLVTSILQCNLLEELRLLSALVSVIILFPTPQCDMQLQYIVNPSEVEAIPFSRQCIPGRRSFLPIFAPCSHSDFFLFARSCSSIQRLLCPRQFNIIRWGSCGRVRRGPYFRAWLAQQLPASLVGSPTVALGNLTCQNSREREGQFWRGSVL